MMAPFGERKNRQFKIICGSGSDDGSDGRRGGRDVNPEEWKDEPSRVRILSSDLLEEGPGESEDNVVSEKLSEGVVIHRPCGCPDDDGCQDIIHIGEMLGLEELVDLDMMYARCGVSGMSLATRVSSKIRSMDPMHRSFAARLITLWAEYNPPRTDSRESAEYHRTELFGKVLEGAVDIVSVRGLYSTAMRMLASQEYTEVPDIENDLLSLGKRAGLFAGLPPRVRSIFRNIARERVEQGKGKPYVFYDDIVSLLDSLSPFTEADPRVAYDLESRIGPRYSYVAPFNPGTISVLRKLETPRERVMASALLMRWQQYRESRRNMPELFNSLGDAGNRSILTGFSHVVRSVDLYLVVNKMLDVQDRVVSPFLEEDIKSLCRETDNYLSLPVKAREFFLSHVGDHIESATKRNCARFNHVADVLHNLGSFSDDTHHKAYRFAQKVKSKDRNGALHQLYRPLGRLRKDFSDCTLRIVDKVLDFIPEDCYLDDPEVKKIHRFLKKLPVIESLPPRLQEIIEQKVDSIDGLHRENRTPEAQHRHDIWNTVRQMQKLTGDELHEDVYDLVAMINDVDKSKVYHYMLRFVGLPPDASDDAIRAAKEIISYLPPAELPEDYDIRRVRRRDDVRWVAQSLNKITSAVRNRSSEPCLQPLPAPAVEVVRTYGPQGCPERLRSVLEARFGKVGRVWDWRVLSKDYWKYEDPVAIYECMSRTGLPVRDVIRLAHDLRSQVMPATGLTMLGDKISYMAACCGTLWREIEFYEALRSEGCSEDAILDIHDNSQLMINRALSVCTEHDVQPGIHIGDIADLSLSHVSSNRQAVVSILGESDGNRLPDERQRTLEGFFREVQNRFYKRGGSYGPLTEGYNAYPDILVVDGSKVKHTEPYEAGWPFIWHAMNSVLGYELDLFTDEGRLCYCTNQNDEGTVEVFFYNNYTRGELRKGDVIWAIDAKALVQDVYAAGAAELGLASRFVDYDDKIVAVLYLPVYDIAGETR